jgi:hypothetical protein
MLLSSLRTKVYLFMTVLLVSYCSSNSSNEELVKEFYTRAKQHESELSILFNVSYTARGKKGDKTMIPRIEIALNEKETITLPGITSEMTDEEIKESSFYKNFEIYSTKIGLPDSAAYQDGKKYSISILNLAHKLEAYKVQSTPRLGEFIIFTLTSEDQVIYIPDLSKVNSDYWMDFFNSGTKLDDNWYYRNIKSDSQNH